MFLLIVLAISIGVALLRGGNLARFADLNLRWRGVILIGFLIQVLIFSDFWRSTPDTEPLTRYAYILSRTILLIALAYNFRIPGAPLLTLGLVLNTIAIIANGGYMPVSQAARALAGLPELAPGQIANNVIGMDSTTQLYCLTDIFAIPKGIPRANAFSVGDLLIAAGAVWLTQRVMVTPTPNKSRGAEL